jgi:hypothetical protein
VNQNPDLEGATDKAAGDLTRLEDQVRAMRSVLVRLLQDVVIAESQLDNGRAHLLVQANEELVVARPGVVHRLDRRWRLPHSPLPGLPPRRAMPCVSQ